MTYPPTTLKTIDGNINILHLTDLHLPLDSTCEINNYNCYQTFQDCLEQALSADIRCDLILLTGDLVNEVNSKIYDRIFAMLEVTGVPFACIAGNHDVTDELDKHLPFNCRKLVARTPDPRLLSQHCIHINNWKLLLLNSACPGKIGGKVSPEDLHWLQQQLSVNSDPVIIAMHHHTLPMRSRWINEHITNNANEFWELISQYTEVKAVVNGHVHQQGDVKENHIINYSTPSTCYQFDPNQQDFSLDEYAQPGYRWLHLNINGDINSHIERLLTS